MAHIDLPAGTHGLRPRTRRGEAPRAGAGLAGGVADRVTNTRIACATLLLLGGCAHQDSSPVAPPVEGGEIQGQVDHATLAHRASDAYARQDWAESERQYVALTRAAPTDPEAWFRLGNIYARTQRAELAIRAYTEALARDPGHVRARHNLGIVQLRLARETFAELARRAASDDPLAVRGRALGEAIDALLAPSDPTAPP